MDFTIPISQNLKKFVKSLQTRKEREESNMFVAEGERLCGELLNSSFTVEFLVLKGNASGSARELAREFNNKGVKIYTSRDKQFEQLCNTKSPQDILAVVRYKSNDFDISQSFIALDGINDPGNLGTIIRTADWFGFNQIIIGGGSVDKFNAKTVRATMGSLFRCTIIAVDNLPEFIDDKCRQHRLFGAMLNAVKIIDDVKPSGKFGIVFGSEAHGLSDEMTDMIDEQFIISGAGGAESLNLAVSVGICCYHFSRLNK